MCVLSYAFWRSEFNGDSGMVGQNVVLNGHAYRVLGVAAQGFTGAALEQRFDVVVPAHAHRRFRACVRWRSVEPAFLDGADGALETGRQPRTGRQGDRAPIARLAQTGNWSWKMAARALTRCGDRNRQAIAGANGSAGGAGVAGGMRQSWRICCWPGRRRAHRNSPCGSRSVHRAGG